MFEELDANAIFNAAKKVQGAAGPSGADADLWKRILCSKQFESKPAKLCIAVGQFAKKLNTQMVPQHT